MKTRGNTLQRTKEFFEPTTNHSQLSYHYTKLWLASETTVRYWYWFSCGIFTILVALSVWLLKCHFSPPYRNCDIEFLQRTFSDPYKMSRVSIRLISASPSFSSCGINFGISGTARKFIGPARFLNAESRVLIKRWKTSQPAKTPSDASITKLASKSTTDRNDWAIIRNLFQYVWPKDDSRVRWRVAFALSLLVGGKVAVQIFWFRSKVLKISILKSYWTFKCRCCSKISWIRSTTRR